HRIVSTSPRDTVCAVTVTPGRRQSDEPVAGGIVNVAIFTDNDFEKVNGVTTTLRALIAHAPDKVDARIYTCGGVCVDSPDYRSLGAHGIGIPFYREMKMYKPPLRRLLRHVQAAGVDVVHLTTPGPVGLAGLWVASKLGVRVIGSFHTDLAEYTRQL